MRWSRIRYVAAIFGLALGGVAVYWSATALVYEPEREVVRRNSKRSWTVLTYSARDRPPKWTDAGLRLLWLMPSLAIAAALLYLATISGSPASPPRHRFQFRLTTWFVLVAILAWAMLQRHWVVTRTARIINGPANSGWPVPADAVQEGTFLMGDQALDYYDISRAAPNPALLWPALALAAFVGWKAAWAVIAARTRPNLNRCVDKSGDSYQSSVAGGSDPGPRL